jgi:hypothetical protein
MAATDDMMGPDIPRPVRCGDAEVTMREASRQTTSEGHSGMSNSSHGAHTEMPDMASHEHVATTGGRAMGGHDQMKEVMARRLPWAHLVNVLLGMGLIASPAALGYLSEGAKWSDMATGTLVVILALSSYQRGRFGAWAQWGNCFAGIWLLFAPLIFWAPTPAEYANQTLMGILIIAFAVLIPGMPGMDMSVTMTGPDIPPGWSYNPSTWLQRVPMILLASFGFLASRYMAAYELKHIPYPWDPFFGDGTRRVLESQVSKMFPVADAGLGAVAYTVEILMGFMGDKARWRTMPWMVTFFGILVVPLGATSIVLIILQPSAVGAWCSLCLFAAMAMLPMIPATLDEVVAMLQFMQQSRREGKSLWRTFWLGGTVEGGRSDERLTPFSWSNPVGMFTTWVASNWNLILSVALGVWLMFAPAILSTRQGAANSDHLLGALVITFAVIAMAEVARAIRVMDILFGAWLLVAPWRLGGFVAGARWSDMLAGVALILLSLPRGHIRGRYGSWQPYIR